MHAKIRQYVSKLSVFAFSFAIVLAIALAATPATHAATLMDRINEALMIAGIPVTAGSQQSFAAGVASGHYTTFDQLVNAMRWHKAHGRMTANTAAFKLKPAKTWVFQGTVTEVNRSRLEVNGLDRKGMEVQKKFKLTANTKVKNGILLFDASEQTKKEVSNEIRRGSVVKVWYTSSREALVIRNLAPIDGGDWFGPVDCTWCAGGTANIDKITPQNQEND